MTDGEFGRQTVVVTGGAQGIGLGVAWRFGAMGSHVVLADVVVEGALSAAAELRAAGHDATGVRLDVRDPDASQALVAQLVEARGAIDVWINNAGVSHLGPSETLSRKAWRQSIDVMASGTFYCSQAVGRHMLERGTGVIVNVASVSGYMTSAGRAAYSAAKAAVVMLTQTLGVEWAPRGVRVVGVAPSVIMTDMVQRDVERGELDLDDCVRRTPLHRLGTVEDIADAIAYLASDAASYITAETMRVDGGWLAYQLF